VDHYHLHCVVTGGGLSLDGRSWVSLNPNWLFPVRALSLVFRAKFREGLQRLFQEEQLQFSAAESSLEPPALFARWLRRLCRPKWVVYTKRPFSGPQAVLGYLCRYTHRVAISNRRLQALDRESGTVTFAYKDYAHGSQFRTMRLSCEEFLRRFCLHILPPRFVKIRHYGLLANRDRPARIAQARELLAPVAPAIPPHFELVLPIRHIEPVPLVCPRCGQRTLILMRIIPRPRGPVILDSS
ncbi:MAG: transposase, partial [Syntrophaceae bacterium]|nr:transposase [Syntrophaceae bacterium]